ncbi:transporter substrate-binding domain-containing protein [Silvanigrella paludirubra]|uniref:Transporter substrate-binding domain-containing protein n=1 Tax=Silvanigrella paludirubra TaxID=2499159 RepID=A0A6N6W0J0_9BACT|nr:transporter substrate-binding domain-containing protein [Silvanigrella paludirubra]KAB8040798.1 transporter substrate-binding domain-containing protein [Silvanigrella paludirubra]
MNKIFLSKLMLFLFVIMPYPAFSLLNITACWDAANRPPFTFAEAQEPNISRGFVIDLLQEIAKIKNFDTIVEGLPWKRCLELTKNGNYQIVLGATENKERRNDYFFSDLIFTTKTVLYYKISKFPQKPIITNIKDYDLFTFCARFGRNYKDLNFEKNIKIYAKNENQLINLLNANRCDFIIGEKETFSSLKNIGILNFSGLAEFEIKGIKPKKYFFLISKNKDKNLISGDDLLKKINEGLKELKENHIFFSLQKKWGIQNN